VPLLNRKNGSGWVWLKGSDIFKALLHDLDTVTLSPDESGRIMLFSHIAIPTAKDMLVIGMSSLYKQRLWFAGADHKQGCHVSVLSDGTSSSWIDSS
jgi:hypothetical protein